MATPLQTLAAEAARLWADISRAQEMIAKLRRPGARSDALDEDLAQIRWFVEEATARARAIESYMMLMKPEDITDAMILVSSATELAKDYASSSDEPHEPTARHRLAARMLEEACALLERESGTTADALGIVEFGGKSATWERTLIDARAILERHGQTDKAA